MRKINYNAYVKQTKATKDKHIYTVEAYLGEIGGKHKYKVRFAECGRVKTVSYQQMQSGSITYSFRKPKVSSNLTKKKKINKKVKVKKELPKGTIIMGLDGASYKSGYSIFKDGKLIQAGLIQKSGNNKHRRIKSMVEEIFYRFKEYKCNYMVIEDIFLGENVKTLMALANLQGVILYILELNNIKYKLVQPSEWKGYYKILKDREAGKGLSIQKVINDYNIKGVNDDVAESILIGQYFLDNFTK